MPEGLSEAQVLTGGSPPTGAESAAASRHILSASGQGLGRVPKWLLTPSGVESPPWHLAYGNKPNPRENAPTKMPEFLTVRSTVKWLKPTGMSAQGLMWLHTS